MLNLNGSLTTRVICGTWIWRGCGKRNLSWSIPWRSKSKPNKTILGILDEGSMCMYNAISDDELLNPCGMYEEAARWQDTPGR